MDIGANAHLAVAGDRLSAFAAGYAAHLIVRQPHGSLLHLVLTTRRSVTRMSEVPSHERLQYLALGLVSFAALGFTALASLFPGTPFQRYLGSINPILAVALVTAVSFGSLGFLHSRGWFQILAKGKGRQGVVVSAAIATLFAIAVVPADLIIRFPQDMNVAPPQSLFFYPAIGYVVEVALHALPLAILLALFGPLAKQMNASRLIWLCILPTSLIEPILQVRIGYARKPLSGTEVYVGLHVFAFNLLQLAVFRRFDFVSMYLVRVVYYLYWHIIWGYLRLQWLL